MINKNKARNVKLELEQSEEVLREARLLMEQGLYKGAVSRAYYLSKKFSDNARLLLKQEGYL